MLAGSESETERGGRGVRVRKGAGAAFGAGFVGDFELIPIPAVGLESADFDVNGMGPIGIGDSFAFANDFAELFVVGNLPGNFDGLGIHAAACELVWSETGPEDKAFWRRIAGSDAE